jgi:AcrR family transcriptional regulator
MTTPTTASAASTRERLLDAAAELFYQEGVHVGVDALCRAAGISKRSMYQQFGSKDEVVAASLQRKATDYTNALLPPDDERCARERILHVFHALERSAEDPRYRGCPYVSAAMELKSPQHPASEVARHQKDRLTAFFQREAQRGGAHDPVLLARQLTVVFDGAGAWGVVQASGLDGLAVSTAQTLLDAAGLRAG